MRAAFWTFVVASACAAIAWPAAATTHKHAHHKKTDAMQGMAMPAAAPAPAAPKEGCEYLTTPEQQSAFINKYGKQAYLNAPALHSENHVLNATLNVAYTDTTIGGCQVHLRTYNGALIGPTLRVEPGDKLNVTFINAMPNDGTPCPMEHSNTPHGFNITNLHTHGLHVSPKDPQDNVLRQVCPGKGRESTWEYHYEIPHDQPPGTAWYHAHVHGSTALQVSSAMEGAIIVEGGQDELPEIAKAKQQVLLLQQIAYDEQGVIESYSAISAWSKSGRPITINGQIVPTIAMQPGEVQYWRFVGGGVGERMPLYISDGHANGYLALNEIATDGNAIGHMDTWLGQGVELDPGYRSDILFKAPMQPGTYYLTTKPVVGVKRLQETVPTHGTSDQLSEAYNGVDPAKTVAIITVSGTVNDMPLPTNAELARFAPFAPITTAELTGKPQHMSFSADDVICPPDPAKNCVRCDPDTDPNPECKYQFMVDMRPYTTARRRVLELNKPSEWSLETSEFSQSAQHPFHIHVNPFQVTRKGPDGQDEIVWKDTLMIEQGSPLKVRSRYLDFDGLFVLHCHILNHEDQGMMELVQIVK